jgi:hypothetical protein
VKDRSGHENVEDPQDSVSFSAAGKTMASRLAISLFALLAASTAAFAGPPLALASHRAAYEVSLTDPAPGAGAAQAPVAASGLIAYEFRGSACEGYASNFRQMTRIERSEGEPLSLDVSATSFEAADGRSMRFEVDSSGAHTTPPVAGTATRATGDEMQVELTKPARKAIDFGHEVLFPTQHVERLIAAARNGGGAVQTRIYDGSDSGAKIYATMAVVGKEASKPSDDADSASLLKGVRRWPVVVSYFDESSKDSSPEYTLSFDLYENGVSGSLKLDYGTFALKAHLTKLEFLPAPACAK